MTTLVANWRECLYGALVGFGALMLILMAIGKVPVSYNVRNLVVRWKTTIMTAMAFTLVVALMTVMMAFVRGMYELTANSGQPGNVVVLASGSNDESFSTLAFGEVSNVERLPGIVTQDGRRLASKEVYVVANQQVPVAPGEKPRRRFVQIRGLEDPVTAGAVHGLPLVSGGQWFSEAGIEQASAENGEAESLNRIQAVLGKGLAAEMGHDRPNNRSPLIVGDTFELADRTWKVVGILESEGSTFDSEIWAKRQIVGDQFGKKASYSSMVVRAADDAEAKKLADELKESKEVALNALVETEYFAGLGETSKQFLGAIVVVALVMSIGGVFGVMNTMFAAISQRTKDIGVLRILGYARWQILVSFLLESLVIALVGGLLGCAIGYVADGLSAKSMISGGPGGGKFVVLRMVVNLDILAAGLLLSMVMGALGGFIPAISAMRTKALESLR